jgi:hypothetical protein
MPTIKNPVDLPMEQVNPFGTELVTPISVSSSVGGCSFDIVFAMTKLAAGVERSAYGIVARLSYRCTSEPLAPKVCQELRGREASPTTVMSLGFTDLRPL